MNTILNTYGLNKNAKRAISQNMISMEYLNDSFRVSEISTEISSVIKQLWHDVNEDNPVDFRISNIRKHFSGMADGKYLELLNELLDIYRKHNQFDDYIEDDYYFSGLGLDVDQIINSLYKSENNYLLKDISDEFDTSEFNWNDSTTLQNLFGITKNALNSLDLKIKSSIINESSSGKLKVQKDTYNLLNVDFYLGDVGELYPQINNSPDNSYFSKLPIHKSLLNYDESSDKYYLNQFGLFVKLETNESKICFDISDVFSVSTSFGFYKKKVEIPVITFYHQNLLSNVEHIIKNNMEIISRNLNSYYYNQKESAFSKTISNGVETYVNKFFNITLDKPIVFNNIKLKSKKYNDTAIPTISQTLVTIKNNYPDTKSFHQHYMSYLLFINTYISNRNSYIVNFDIYDNNMTMDNYNLFIDRFNLLKSKLDDIGVNKEHMLASENPLIRNSLFTVCMKNDVDSREDLSNNYKEVIKKAEYNFNIFKNLSENELFDLYFEFNELFNVYKKLIQMYNFKQFIYGNRELKKDLDTSYSNLNNGLAYLTAFKNYYENKRIFDSLKESLI